MKPLRTKEYTALYHYVDGVRVAGPNPAMYGDCTSLRGNCSGLSGDLDGCEITDAEREAGVRLADLVGG